MNRQSRLNAPIRVDLSAVTPCLTARCVLFDSLRMVYLRDARTNTHTHTHTRTHTHTHTHSDSQRMFHLRDEQIVNYRKLFSAMDADGGGSLVRLPLHAPCHTHVSYTRCVDTAVRRAPVPVLCLCCTPAAASRFPLSARSAGRISDVNRVRRTPRDV